jgi:antitoxin (DNA-binding transcriptional repressor) of toxin-antitoxin stability system
MAIMDLVSRSGEPVIITKRGKPILELVPDEKQPTIFLDTWLEDRSRLGTSLGRSLRSKIGSAAIQTFWGKVATRYTELTWTAGGGCPHVSGRPKFVRYNVL